jgi:isoleucyl-tRNA synthetase
MGRYGITIKNPKFDGIGFEYGNNDIDELLTIEKAKLCSLALKQDKKIGAFCNTNDIKYIVNNIKQYLIIKYRKQFENWVDNETLYIDCVGKDCSKYSIEDYIEEYESFILNDLEMVYIAVMCDAFYYTTEYYRDELRNSEVYDIFDKVRVLVNKLVSDLEETIETYVGYKIALLNFDNIVPEKELTLEDLEPVNEELEHEE